MAPDLTPATFIVASKNHVSAPLSGETVILDMSEGVYYGLDPVGTRIWALIQEPRTLGDVAAVIESEFEVSGERALADLVALTRDLVARGLAEVLPAAAAP